MTLQDWCRRSHAECLAVQLPGRSMHSTEPFLTSLQEAARQLLPVVASRLQDTPYIVGHASHNLFSCLCMHMLTVVMLQLHSCAG